MDDYTLDRAAMTICHLFCYDTTILTNNNIVKLQHLWCNRLNNHYLNGPSAIANKVCT